jgi:hypothetical protein
MNKDQLEQLARESWEGCHGCDENDKYFWMNGFITGYLRAKIDNVDDNIKRTQNKIAEILINPDYNLNKL